MDEDFGSSYITIEDEDGNEFELELAEVYDVFMEQLFNDEDSDEAEDE